MSREYPNPLIPGFNPDPSVVRVGDDYYLATSTFEYLPAIPIYHSTDFVTWTQIGNVSTSTSQLGLENVTTAGGVWAPTIRYHDGTFYLIVTIAMGIGCVVFTAIDPAGPWTEPVVIEGVAGIDPDLAWDSDGTAYVTFSGLITTGPDIGKHLGVQQVRVDLAAHRAIEEPRSLWSGSGFKFPEAPHLYERGGWWYLMIAEGGTERGHGVSIARSKFPDRDFEPAPNNPFLSARSTNRPIQNTGHGDLVEGPEGETLMVLLGMRPRGGTQAFSALGRETFVTRVYWGDDGWPSADPVVLAPRAGITEYSIDFAEQELDDAWLAIRQDADTVSTFDTESGRLVIPANGSTLDDPRPAFLGRRQLNQTADASTLVDVDNGAGGIAVRYDEHHHYSLEARADGDTVVVTARARLATIEQFWTATFAAGPIELHVDAQPAAAGFNSEGMTSDFVHLRARSGEQEVTLARVDGRYLSAETAASFTGRVIGIFATSGAPEFSWFRYRGSED